MVPPGTESEGGGIVPARKSGSECSSGDYIPPSRREGQTRSGTSEAPLPLCLFRGEQEFKSACQVTTLSGERDYQTPEPRRLPLKHLTDFETALAEHFRSGLEGFCFTGPQRCSHYPKVPLLDWFGYQ